MTDKAWKQRERRICRLFGGERRGPDGYGQTDCKNCDYAIEIKNWSSPTFKLIQEEVAKAEARAQPGQIPIAVTFKKGMKDMDGIVSMTVKSFLEWFGPSVEDYIQRFEDTTEA